MSDREATPSIEGVVVLLTQAVEQLSALGLHSDAEDVARTIRYLEQERESR